MFNRIGFGNQLLFKFKSKLCFLQKNYKNIRIYSNNYYYSTTIYNESFTQFDRNKKFPVLSIDTILRKSSSSSSNNDGENNRNFHKKIQWRWDLITSFLALFGIVELPKDSPLILSIKQGILAKQRKQYHKAEMLLHTALKMAQDLSNTDAETYIFDVMADNYFEKGNHQKALDLYLEVLQRFSQKETFTVDCEELIELSIKMAYCYGCLNQTENAEKGFSYAIDSQILRTKSYWNDKKSEILLEEELNDEQRNSLALLGMAYDYYSKFLESLSSKLLERSLVYRLKSLKISQAINGDKHNQTMVLENDIAQLYVRMEKYDLAKKLLRQIIEKAKSIESIDLPIYYLNLASIYFQENRQDFSKRYCREAFDLVSKNNKNNIDDSEELNEKDRLDLLEKSEKCLNGLKFY